MGAATAWAGVAERLPIAGVWESQRAAGGRMVATQSGPIRGGEAGVIEEVQSPDDNLQAVFRYLVKQ